MRTHKRVHVHSRTHTFAATSCSLPRPTHTKHRCHLYQPRGHPSHAATRATYSQKGTHIYEPSCQLVTLTPCAAAGSPLPSLPSSPTTQAKTRTQKQREGRASGLRLGTNIPGGSGSLLLRSRLPGLGEGRPRGAQPSLGCLPTPLGRDFRERGAQVTVTSGGLARPCWPPSFLPSQHFGPDRGRRTFGLLCRVVTKSCLHLTSGPLFPASVSSSDKWVHNPYLRQDFNCMK